MSKDPSHAPAPLAAVLAVTFIASLGTSVFWNGLSFIAKHAYGFDEVRCLYLYLATGIVYIVGAAGSGRLMRALGRTVSPRAFLMANMAILAVASPLVFLRGSDLPLWIVACLSSALSATYWPVMESYVTAGRHGAAMRSALGWWNVTWTSAVGVALLLMAPLAASDSMTYAIGALCPINVVGILLLLRFPHRPPPHAHESSPAVPAEYPRLLQSARVLLPMSYLLVGTLSPLMPYLLDVLSVPKHFETPMAAVWTFARIAAMALMWRLAFWHGRWGTLVLGAVAMTGGFGVVILAPSVWVMCAGLALFGGGLGIVYFAAIYYAMTVGHAEVDAGGTHEALIGLGYAVGPIAALVGGAWGGGPATIGIVWALVGLAAVPAVMPYLRARSARLSGASARQATAGDLNPHPERQP